MNDPARRHIPYPMYLTKFLSKAQEAVGVVSALLDHRVNHASANSHVHVVEVGPGDDVAIICERLQWVNGQRVILSIHRKNRTLRDKVNFRLVQREAVDQAIDLAIVARHRDTLRVAQEVGLAVFPVTWLGKHIRPWHSVAASTFVPNADGDGLRVVIRHPAIARHHNHLVSVIIMAILILVAAGLTVVVVPSAQVTLSPVTEDVSTKLTILANPAARGISAPLGQIPARIEEMAIEGTESSVPVAKRDVPDARATGQIVATNKTDQPIHLSKGTVVATSSGVPIRFQTTADVDLPSKGRAEVAISAIEPGPTGNVARFTVNAIEGQYSAAVNVVNANPTSGGTVRRVPVVTEEDKRRLEEVLAKRLKQEAISKFQAKVKNQEFVAPDTVSVILDSKTFDKFVDEPADLLTLTAHATARGTFVYGGDANVVALKRLESNLRPGYALLANTVVYTPGAVLGVDQDVLRFELVAAGQSASMVDANLVAMSVRGMTVPEARDWIANQFSLRREPAIALQPDWIDLGRMPLLGFRISIEFLP